MSRIETIGDATPHAINEDAADQLKTISELREALSNLMFLVEPMVRGNREFSVTWRKYVREARAALKAAGAK